MMNKKPYKISDFLIMSTSLTLIVLKYSATLFMQVGGGSYLTPPPPLFPAIGFIEGQTKKQMIKLYKNTNFGQF